MTEYKQSESISNEAERLRLIGLTANNASREALTKLNESGFKPAKILDAGCGTGDAFAVISEVFPEAELTGLDQSEKAVAVAESRGVASKTIVGDVLDLGAVQELAQNGPYDLVFIRNTLLHIPDLGVAIAQLKSLLGEDGVLLLQEPDWDYADANWEDFNIFKQSITTAMRAHGINPTVGKDLEGCAAEQGLQNIEVTVFENRTNAGDEGWDVIEFLLDVSGGMIGGELAKAGVESVNEMKARVAKAAKDPNNYFDNPAWVVLIANK